MKKVITITVQKGQLDAINSKTLVYKLKARLFIVQLKKKGYKAWLSKNNCIIIDSSLPNKIAKKIIDLGFSRGLGIDIY